MKQEKKPFRLYDYENMVMIALLCIAMCFAIIYCSSSPKEQQCKRCMRMEKSIRHILIDIEEHDPDFVMDVLSETDDWFILEDLISPIEPPVIINDSTYRKLRRVFPDLPKEQQTKWKRGTNTQ